MASLVQVEVSFSNEADSLCRKIAVGSEASVEMYERLNDAALPDGDDRWRLFGTANEPFLVLGIFWPSDVWL